MFPQFHVYQEADSRWSEQYLQNLYPSHFTCSKHFQSDIKLRQNHHQLSKRDALGFQMIWNMMLFLVQQFKNIQIFILKIEFNPSVLTYVFVKKAEFN